MATKKSFLSTIQKSKHLTDSLYKEEPTMMPPHIMPKIQLVHINVPERVTPGKSKKQTDIRQALLSKLNDTEELPVVESPFISPEQEAMIKKELNTNIILSDKLKMKNTNYLFPRINEAAMSSEELFNSAFSQHCELNDWNQVLHQTYLLSHSCDAELLCHLLSKAESMQLGQHTDLNSQVDHTSIKLNNNKFTKSKETTDNCGKKKKTEKERNKGMDIRQCMAVAADRLRLTQDEHVNNNTLFSTLIPEPVNINITLADLQDRHPCTEDQKNSDDRSTNYKIYNNCSLCGKVPLNKYFKPQDNKLTPFTENNLFAEEFVNNITKDMIERINVDNIVSKSGFVINDIKNRILAIKNNYANKKIHYGVQYIKANIDNETPTKITPLHISTKKPKLESRATDMLQNANLDPVSKEEYFDLEDIFNDDNDDLVIFDLKSKNQTSTPITKIKTNKINMMSETNSDNIKTNNLVQNQRNIVNLNDKSISLLGLTPESSNVFKMPHIKLNLQTLKSPHSVLNSYCSKLSNDRSPESPVLSGQTSANPTPASKFGRKVLFPEEIDKTSNVDMKHSPESPILSGQISLKPKLEKRVLFGTVEKENSEYSLLDYKSQNSVIQNEQLDKLAVEEDNLLSVSQLFDEDSDEKSHGDHLEQSSLYTISQMVAKVSTMTRAEPIEQTPEIDETINKSNNINFGSSDDDTLFENIDLDALSKDNVSLPNNKVINNETIEEINKQTIVQNNDTSSELFSAHYDSVNLLENTSLQKVSNDSTKQISFSRSNSLSSMKSSALKHIYNTKTSTPYINKISDHLSDSDSNSDVFQSIAVNRKKEFPINVNIVPKKVKKPKLFLELEADVTGPLCSSDEENTSGLDELDESFINDLTEHPSTSLNHTVLDMQARYLQSVRSPVKKPGGFKIPTVSESVLARDVFSQVIEEDDESYENDSFCCDATEVPIDDNLSILEIAERLLDKKRKSRKEKRKRKHSSSSESNVNNEISFRKCPKRKISSSSGDDNNDNSNKSKHFQKKKLKYFLDSSIEDFSIETNKSCKRKRSNHLLSSDSSDSCLENQVKVMTLNKKKKTVVLDSDSDSTV